MKIQRQKNSYRVVFEREDYLDGSAQDCKELFQKRGLTYRYRAWYVPFNREILKELQEILYWHKSPEIRVNMEDYTEEDLKREYGELFD